MSSVLTQNLCMKLAIDSTKAVTSGLLSTGCLTSGSYTIPKSSPSKWMFCILNYTMQKGNRYVAFHWSQVVHDHYDYKDAKFPNIFSTIFFLYISLSFPSRLLLFVYILTATMTRCWWLSASIFVMLLPVFMRPQGYSLMRCYALCRYLKCIKISQDLWPCFERDCHALGQDWGIKCLSLIADWEFNFKSEGCSIMAS